MPLHQKTQAMLIDLNSYLDGLKEDARFTLPQAHARMVKLDHTVGSDTIRRAVQQLAANGRLIRINSTTYRVNPQPPAQAPEGTPPADDSVNDRLEVLEAAFSTLSHRLAAMERAQSANVGAGTNGKTQSLGL